MTVCIAARSSDILVLAADRMLTAGDIQFEPKSRSKIYPITSAIAVMMSGDAGFQDLVVSPLARRVGEEISRNPQAWFSVQRASELYVELWNSAKRFAAEQVLLAPLGMTVDTFIQRHRDLDPSTAKQLTTAVIDYEVPSTSAIIAGKDEAGTHIFLIDDATVSSNQSVGFATIGIGGRHAGSELMLGRHSWNAPLADTLFLTYIAKRRAEIAPGVGVDTDFFTIGPGLGQFGPVGDHVIVKLESEYRALAQREAEIRETANAAITTYIDELLASQPSDVEDQRKVLEESGEVGGPDAPST